jgi:hypothetical protein
MSLSPYVNLIHASAQDELGFVNELPSLIRIAM